MAVDYIPYIRKKVGHDEILSVSLAALIVNHEGKILLEKRRDWSSLTKSNSLPDTIGREVNLSISKR